MNTSSAPTYAPVPFRTLESRWWLPAAILVLTEAQLLVAEFVPGIERFEGKAFGARLIAYPVLMLIAPALWWCWQARTGRRDAAPTAAFALIMTPFLIDVTGNSANLYDTVSWWDDANHLLNWVPLNIGVGLLVAANLPRAWQKILLVAGLGALLAVGWELAEYVTFIRHSPELQTAYTDTLWDEVLGTSGGFVAGVVTAVATRSR